MSNVDPNSITLRPTGFGSWEVYVEGRTAGVVKSDPRTCLYNGCNTIKEAALILANSRFGTNS